MPSAQQIINEQFWEMRWRCLSLAADLDRIERAEGGPEVLQDDPRLKALREAIGLLMQPGMNRAERVQNIFSDKTPPPT